MTCPPASVPLLCSTVIISVINIPAGGPKKLFAQRTPTYDGPLSLKLASTFEQSMPREDRNGSLSLQRSASLLPSPLAISGAALSKAACNCSFETPILIASLSGPYSRTLTYG